MQLNQNQVVTLKHYTGREFSKGIITSVKKDMIMVKSSKECGVFSYFTNDPLVLGLIEGDTLFMCECTITNINYAENSVELKIEKCYPIEEKRTAERFPTSIYGVIVKSQVKGAVYITNISNSGLSIKSKAVFEEEDEIEIEAYVNKKLLSIHASILWKKLSRGEYEYGLNIINNNITTQQIIDEYIEALKLMQRSAMTNLIKQGPKKIYQYSFHR